jgi:hypothetical protein
VAVLVIAASGTVYRVWAQKLDALSQIKVLPSIPFDQFPKTIGNWQGEDVPISETVLKVAANDDYVHRFYVNNMQRQNGSLYVAYTAEPRRMLGHRPRVCYVGNGWIHDGSEDYRIETSSGRTINALLHRFHRPGLDYQNIIVINYYVINGVPTSNHKDFSGLRWRRPKKSDGRMDYVAQVQISSISESAAKTMAAEMSDPVFFHLPAAQEN